MSNVAAEVSNVTVSEVDPPSFLLQLCDEISHFLLKLGQTLAPSQNCDQKKNNRSTSDRTAAMSTPSAAPATPAVP